MNIKRKLKKKKGLGGKKPLSKQQYQKTLAYFISKGVPIGFIQDSIIGGAKELIYDKYMNKGNCELLDFIYTIAPCILYLITLVF